jgi:hypothetical protein
LTQETKETLTRPPFALPESGHDLPGSHHLALAPHVSSLEVAIVVLQFVPVCFYNTPSILSAAQIGFRALQVAAVKKKPLPNLFLYLGRHCVKIPHIYLID